MTHTIESFLPLSQKELAQALVTGHPFDPRDLDDTEYKGISLGLPAFIDKLAWKTFKKVFHRDPQTGHLRGWNVRTKQTGLHGEYMPMEKHGEIFTWGHYRVVPGTGRRMPKPVQHGQLIDYGIGGNYPLDLSVRFMRDPLVALEKGSTQMLLGWSYLEIGPFAISTPSYFLLVKDGPLRHMAFPPR